MKKSMIIMAILALISFSLQAGPKVEMKTSGPSGQGDLIWWAPSTGVTNLRMTVNGLTYITLYESPSIVNLTVSGDATIGTNATVGGTLKVTGTVSNAALTASKPVFTDANKVLVSTGTLAVDQGGSGAATLTDHGVLVGSGTAAVTPLAVGTDGQLLVGASSADPAWATVGGAFTMAAGGTSTLIGNIAQARITNALIDAIGTAQMADEDHGDVAWASGVATVDKGLAMTNGASLQNIPASTALTGVVPLANGGAGDASGILKANGAGLVSAASAGTDYLAPNTVWGYPGLATVTNLLENAVTITAKDTAGATLAGYRLFHIWVSDSDKGAATTNNIETLVLSTGTAISTVTANADYWYCSAAAGTAVATVTATAAGTNYLMVADGSSISSIALVETE